MELELKNYLEQHAILCIGKDYSDVIVDNPYEFIARIKKLGGCITEILWWDRIEIAKAKNSLGAGGPSDPRNGKYFFSETNFTKSFGDETSIYEYELYLNEMFQNYPEHDLYPSFTWININ